MINDAMNIVSPFVVPNISGELDVCECMQCPSSLVNTFSVNNSIYKKKLSQFSLMGENVSAIKSFPREGIDYRMAYDKVASWAINRFYLSLYNYANGTEYDTMKAIPGRENINDNYGHIYYGDYIFYDCILKIEKDNLYDWIVSTMPTQVSYINSVATSIKSLFDDLRSKPSGVDYNGNRDFITKFIGRFPSYIHTTYNLFNAFSSHDISEIVHRNRGALYVNGKEFFPMPLVIHDTDTEKYIIEYVQKWLKTSQVNGEMFDKLYDRFIMFSIYNIFNLSACVLSVCLKQITTPPGFSHYIDYLLCYPNNFNSAARFLPYYLFDHIRGNGYLDIYSKITCKRQIDMAVSIGNVFVESSAYDPDDVLNDWTL